MDSYRAPSEVIPYNPNPFEVAIRWKTGVDVLQYLVNNTAERARLLQEVQQRTQGKPRYFIIYHPLLHYDLCVHSECTEFQFITAIYGNWALEVLHLTEKEQT